MENEQQPEQQPQDELAAVLATKTIFETLSSGMTRLMHDLAAIRDLQAAQEDRTNLQMPLYDQLNQRVSALEPHGRPN
jgi:hypothetical protein